MNAQASLDKMRELKLAGMAATWEAILQRPAHEQPTGDDLLAQLLDAEQDERLQRRTRYIVSCARFRYHAMLEEIHYLPNRNLDRDLVLRLADGSFVKKAQNILITGATGCGKSYLATAFGLQACSLGFRVGYYHAGKLFQKLKAAKADGSYPKELKTIEKQSLIILDDFGLQPLDALNKLALLDILEDRHGRRATIITSQIPVAKWYALIEEQTLADAILDRIVHGAHRIELSGESLRKTLTDKNII
jgi:DNA replication protein DnaC